MSIDASIEKCQGFLLTSDYVWADVPTANLISDHYPHVSWHETALEQYVAENPYRSLIDCRDAKETLGWQPEFSTKDLLMNEIKAGDV